MMVRAEANIVQYCILKNDLVWTRVIAVHFGLVIPQKKSPQSHGEMRYHEFALGPDSLRRKPIKDFTYTTLIMIIVVNPADLERQN